MTEYHVHIVTIGFDPEPSMDVDGCGIPVDKVYLFNDPASPTAVESEKKILNHLNTGNIETVCVKIDCYDYEEIYNKVLEISENEKKLHPNVRFHINFSRGTAIAVSAVCCAAFELNSDLYYVKFKKGEKLLPIEERVIQIQIDNVHEQVYLTPRTEAVLKEFGKSEERTNTNLLEGLSLSSKGSLSRHTNTLKSQGLITESGKGRETVWVITGKGRKLLKRLNFQSNRS